MCTKLLEKENFPKDLLQPQNGLPKGKIMQRIEKQLKNCTSTNNLAFTNL